MPEHKKTALVLGAGGFIGSHMVKRLRSEGYWVRGVDLKYPEYTSTQAHEFVQGDLRDVRFVRECIQFKGYAGNHSISTPVCDACQSGQYSDELGQESCDECLDSLHVSAIASVAVAQCFCRVGYHGDQYGCTACVAGTYSSAGVCLPCVDLGATFYSEEGAVRCTSCGVGTQPAPDQTRCAECEDGFVSPYGSCQPCLPGTESNELRSACVSCTVAGSGVYSEDGRACSLCDHGMRPISDRTACEDCPINQIGTDGQCRLPCDALNCHNTTLVSEQGSDAATISLDVMSETCRTAAREGRCVRGASASARSNGVAARRRAASRVAARAVLAPRRN